MKARKMVIAVFAAVLAVQMAGCNKTIDTNKPVVIDVSVSDSDIESEAELTWTELGTLTTYEEMRTAVDAVFGNEVVDGLKYGPFYIDTTGAQCTNNTLKVVLGNRYVAEMFATGGTVDIEKLDPTNLGAIEVSEETTEDGTSAMESAFNNSLDATYTDLSDSDRTPALINAYFNLLPDSTPNYFNGGDTLSRAEAMALVTRATTPVMTLTAVDGFEESVTGTDFDQYINYAAQQNDNAYINTSDKSLTPDNFKGAMSRAEFIYLVMNDVYTTEAVQAFDTTNTALKDCINAGDLSAELKISDADHCNSQTLSHSLKNVDKGVCTALYNSLAMAVDKGVITPETRWNEGITKAEAIEIVFNAFSAYYEDNGYLVNNADKGSLQALEEQALELWNKQDKNDMNCTEEEFIADYILDMENGVTPEEFEESIQDKYSIAFDEIQEQAEQEAILNTHIKALWERLQDRLTCDEDTFSDEYKSQLETQGDSFTEDAFTDYILDKYGIPEETQAPSNNSTGGSTGNTDSGSGGNTYTPPTQTEPVYTPPAQTEPVETTPVTPPVQEPVETTPVTPPADTGGSSGGGGNAGRFDPNDLIGDPDDPWYELG